MAQEPLVAEEVLQDTTQIVAQLAQVDPNTLAQGETQNEWHQRAVSRPSSRERLTVLLSMYERMLETTLQDGPWPWKATTLCLIADQFWQLGFHWLSKRYAMLALCDECRVHEGNLPATTGSYQRLLVRHGLSAEQIARYARRANTLFVDATPARRFPESVLMELDQDWKTETPTTIEYGQYYLTRNYLRFLMREIVRLQANRAQTRQLRGQLFELISEYVISCMPGARTQRRVFQQGTATDYDVVCSMDGFHVDFRSELGRYFVGECKEWQDEAPFDVMAKFCRVLDQVKSRFGILFSSAGITGQNQGLFAEAEQLNVFRDRGIVIAVIQWHNLQHLAQGRNFINVLRTKYDQVRVLQEIALDPDLDQQPQDWVP